MDGSYWAGQRIAVTGGAGFIGSHVVRRLKETRGVTANQIVVPRSQDSDLRVLSNCERVLMNCDVVIHLAAVTGGISFSREHCAAQYFDSTLIDLNVVEASRRVGVKKLVAIGNLFAYAPDAPIPLNENDLWNGLPTDAHRGVGWMKRNLALLADIYYRQYGFQMSVVYSANAYGPGDSTDPAHAHVIPATIMKCLREPRLVVWGDGSPTRDFLHVQDVAEGLLLAVEKLAAPGYVNIGSGAEISIRELVELIARFSDFRGSVEFDHSKLGGDARRCTSITRARDQMGFAAKISMAEGIRETVEWYHKKLKDM